ncbi:hypothetical protein AOQ84DRAFT_221578 [Glonium stellatum]|uniref:Rhodopsin domain-containing protein n=1 Tax=Glonium stellatum TaxID=574774 RepID=A0A8E2JTG3_9PEZI|nr:hypothetical protein AOQ84DRAFT_221578 [Glonium stellatum]
MGLRFCAARVQRRKLRFDDYLIVGAFASLMTLEGTTCWAITNNLGAHTNTLTPYQASVQLKALVVILGDNLDLVNGTIFKLAIYVVMGITACYAPKFIPIFFIHCAPLSASWDPDPVVQVAKCRPISRQEYASVAINMALDLTVVLLPIPVVWGLQIPTRKKVFHRVCNGLADPVYSGVNHRPRLELYLYITALQSHLELWPGIIAANLPTLAPLFNKFIMPVIKSYLGSRGSKQPSGGKHILRTFGSGDQPKRDKFNHLDDDSLDYPGELSERQTLSKVETDAPLSRGVDPFVISMRRDFEVGVELFDRPQKEVIQAHSSHNDVYPAIDPTQSSLSHAGQTIIVTGAGSGIGRETAIAFAASGAKHVVLVGRTESTLLETQKLIPNGTTTCSVFAGSVTDEEAMDRAPSNE